IERASVASQSTTHVTADLKFAPNEEAQFVDAISCWEIPRIKISSSVTAEHGVDASAFVSGASIDQETFGSIWNATNATEIGARALFHWAVPYRTTASSPLTTWASSTTSASFVDVMDSDVPILLRKLSVGNTTETLTGRVFWWTSDGTTTCEVRLTSGATNGTALSATPTTTPAWSDAFTVAADCEDLSEATGLQGGSFTVGGVEFRRTAGSGTLYVSSAMAYEA
ncbi:MAG: hypothetical protein GY944_24455, partial [bacterium]|nr:hypothetical protein [bacterium]